MVNRPPAHENPDSPLDPKPPVIRYERERPGELIHLDTKKLGKIDGIGHRITGHRTGMTKNRGIGWDHLHVAGLSGFSCVGGRLIIRRPWPW